jgi:flagellin-like protein
MKKIWKIRKDSEAVSPVIATILMVAITVVLAAVLYVMVMGFGPGGASAPQGSFTSVQKMSATVERVSIGVLTPDTKPTAIKIVVQERANSSTYTFASDTSGTMALVVGGTPATGITSIVYTNLGGGTIVSSGSYLTFTMTAAGTGATTYIVSMIWIQNSAVIDDISFSW